MCNAVGIKHGCMAGLQSGAACSADLLADLAVCIQTADEILQGALFLFEGYLENRVIRQGPVPAQIGDNGGGGCVPDAQLAARGLAHGGIAQVEDEMRLGQPSVKLRLRHKAVDRHPVCNPQFLKPAFEIGRIPDIPHDVEAEIDLGGQRAKGLQHLLKAAVGADIAELHKAQRACVSTGGRDSRFRGAERQVEQVGGRDARGLCGLKSGGCMGQNGYSAVQRQFEAGVGF